MAKEVMVVTPEQIQANIRLSAAAADTLKWMIENAGVEMDEGAIADFVAARKLRDREIVDIWELKAWCEKTAACIKEVAKHTYNLGSEEDLPPNVKWAKQSFTYEFVDGAGIAIADALIKKHLVTKEQLFQQLTVSQVIKAAGLTVDKIVDMFPDTILAKAKERTLTIK